MKKTSKKEFRSALELSRVLDVVWTERKKKNPKFSLRAFAKVLGISHTLLNRLMRAEATVSYRRMTDLTARLGISGEDALQLLRLVRAEKELTPEVRELLERKQTDRIDVIQIPAERFEGLSLFQVMAIVEALEFSYQLRERDRAVTAERISEVTKYRLSTVKKVLGILEQVGLVERVESLRYVRTARRWEITHPPKRSTFFDIHHEALNQIMRRSLHEPKNRRLLATEWVCIPESSFPELMDAANEFFDRLHRLSATPDKNDAVILLALHGVPFFRRGEIQS